MENEAANAAALTLAAGGSNSLDVASATTVSSVSNLTTSSVSSGGATNDDPMNMTMSGSIEDVKPSTVDLSSFLVKSEVGEQQCFVTQNPI